MHLISASRRTDIPHYHAAWFAARRRAGFAEYRTVYGGGKNGYFRASLRPEETLGYLFWTKFAGPFHTELAALRRDGLPYAFQYTVNGYGPLIEPGVPALDKVLEDFKRVAEALPGPGALQWRYDPILLGPGGFSAAAHLARFSRIAETLQGLTRVVNVSFAEPYAKAVLRTPAQHDFRWRPGREAVFARRPGLRAVGAEGAGLLREFSAAAAARGIQLRVCCNAEYAGEFPAAQCCGAELFEPYGPELQPRLAAQKPAPTRPACRCLKAVDIGMDETCPAGCFYCYVTGKPAAAAENFRRVKADCPHLR